MEALEYLNSLGQFKIEPGLERIQQVLKNLDAPHLEYPTVHIGGTNGKGSTAFILGALMKEFDISTGIYTSPHLLRLNERMVFDGEEVGSSDLERAVDTVRKLVVENGPSAGLTYFEVLTCAYFLLCRDKDPEMSIVEVGMGGRWDATNVVQPHAVCITSISLDHTEHLGEDRISIAREKAGIIKPSTPVVIGPQSGEDREMLRALRVMLGSCNNNGCPVIVFCTPEKEKKTIDTVRSMDLIEYRVMSISELPGDEDPTFGLRTVDQGGSWADGCFHLVDRYLPGEHACDLKGRHQAGNAACALALAFLTMPTAYARMRMDQGDLSASEGLLNFRPEEVTERYDGHEVLKKINSALKKVSLPGRIETRRIAGKNIVIDGGHNPEASANLIRTVSSLYPGRGIHLLMTMMREKDPYQFISHMIDEVQTITLLELPTERAMKIQKLVNGICRQNRSNADIFIFRDPKKGFEHWVSSIGSGPEIGLACGSFYLYPYLHEFMDDL